MNAARLLEYYHRIADGPDAIPRLRRFILDLAVRGKLVLQDAQDEPATAALYRMKIQPVLDGPFKIPDSWEWSNVGSVANSRLGKMLDKAKNKGVHRPYLRNINVRWFDFDLSDLLEMRFEDKELSEFSLSAGDVLICEGGEPGRAAVWDDRAEGIYFQKAIHRVRFGALVDPNYFVHSLKASADDGRLRESFTGTGIKHFTGKGLETYRFPLPPLTEQRRIVAKIDELMSLCDQLEAARIARELVRDRLTTTSLARLSVPNPETFSEDADLALNALREITTRSDQIKQLRQAILSLAVRGKLATQDPADEPASELLKQIANKKLQQGLKQVTWKVESEEIPFSLPVGWSWSRIGEICSKTGSGSTPRGGKEVYTATGIPFLRSQNIYDNGLRLNDVAYIDRSMHERMNGTHVLGGDLLLNITGGSMGRCCRVPDDFKEANISQHVAIIRVAHRGIQDFLHRLVLSPYFQSFVFHEQTGAGRGGLPKNRMDMIAVALPPLAEQRRIVAKVDALMRVCDRLETSLESTTAISRRLLDSLLAEALLPVDAREMEAAE
jgi:type I restriction enzyme, S subunit